MFKKTGKTTTLSVINPSDKNNGQHDINDSDTNINVTTNNINGEKLDND